MLSGLHRNLTKSIRKTRLSRGLICIRFDDLTLLSFSDNRLFRMDFVKPPLIELRMQFYQQGADVLIFNFQILFRFVLE